MKRRLPLIAIGLALIAGSLVFYANKRTDNPSFKNRPIREWLMVLADPKSDVLQRDEAETAFVDMGTNALIVLTNQLFATESYYSRWRHDGGEKLPDVIRNHIPSPLPAVLLRRASAKQLSLLGGDARLAAPYLAAALNDPDRVVRGYCYNMLNRLRAPADIIVPGLLAALHSPDPSIREFGAGELGFIGPDAKAGVPALILALDDIDESVRLNAIIALGRIGPAARPSLPRLRELLRSTKPEIRLNSAATLTKLDLQEAKLAVPIFAELLKDQDSSMVEVALRQLSDLGSLASDAIPQVETLLEHEDKNLRRLAEDTLNRIDKRGGSF